MKNRILSGIVAFAIVLSALANTGAVYAYGSESETENGNAVTQTVPADTTPEESTTPAETTTEALPTETTGVAETTEPITSTPEGTAPDTTEPITTTPDAPEPVTICVTGVGGSIFANDIRVDGSWTGIAGEPVVFRIVPDAGYSILSVAANGTYLSADENGNFTVYPEAGMTVTYICKDTQQPTVTVDRQTIGWALTAVYQITAGDNSPEELTIAIEGGNGEVVNATQIADRTYTAVISTNGTYTVTVTDNDGNCTTQTFTESRIDNTPPEIEGLSRDTDSWSQSASYTFTVTDAAVKTVVLRADGEETCLTPAPDGTYTFRVAKNQESILEVTDYAGNITSLTVTESLIDTTLPTIQDITRTQEGWAQTGSYTIRAEDAQSGIKSVIIMDGEIEVPLAKSENGEYIFHATKNQVYGVAVTDNAGNVSTATFEELLIDTTAPEISGIVREPETWSQTGSYTFCVTDNSAQISKVVMWDGKTESVLTPGVDGLYSFIVAENRDYEIMAWDAAGNRASVTVTESKIDLTAPEFKDVQPQSTWDAEKNTIRFFVDDDKQLVNIICRDINGKVIVIMPLGKNTYEITVTENGEYTITAMDMAGNLAEVTTTVSRIDTDAPAITEMVSSANGAWTNQDVTLTVAASDMQSGVAAIWYCDRDIPFDEAEWKQMPMTADGLGEVVLSAEQNTTYYVVAVDNVGRISTPATISVKIDKTSPAPAGIVPEKATGTGGWYTRYPSYQIQLPDQGEQPSAVSYIIRHAVNGVQQPEITYDGTNAPVIDRGGIWDIQIIAVDEAGNSAAEETSSFTFRVDTKAPDGMDITLNGNSILQNGEAQAYWDQVNIVNGVAPVSYTIFLRDAITIHAAANGGNSGLGGLYYQTVSHGEAYNPAGSWKELGADGIILEPNRLYTVYIKAVDGAGNTTIYNSTGIILDNNAPAGADGGSFDMTVRRDGISAHGFYSGDVAVDVAVFEPKPESAFSGIHSITYRVLRDGEVTQSGQMYPGTGEAVTEDERISAWMGTVTVNAENNSNNIVVEITATDRAGNQRTSRIEEGIIKIDISQPEVHAVYDRNDPVSQYDGKGAFTGSRKLTVSVLERNFVAEESIVTVIRDNYKPITYTWEQTDDGYIAVIPVTADGHYTVAVQITDAAGNRTTVPVWADGTEAAEAFIIDNTIPEFMVRYDNNNSKNSKYFPADRIMMVTVKERNFDPDAFRIRVEVTAEDGTKQYLPHTEWIYDGSTYTTTVNCSVEGRYKVHVQGTDALGNIAFGQFAGMSTTEWVLDKHIDTPIFSGVTAGGAYNDSIVPVVAVLDANIDSATICLYKADMNGYFNKMKEMKERADYTHGQRELKIVLDIFDKEQQNDGIYAVEVVAVDRAGNTSSNRIVFSVNRFGSIYVYSDFLSGLLNGYRQEITEDIVITEYNPSGFYDGSQQVYITRDGSMLPAFSYSVSSSPAQKEGQWHTNTYVIAKDTFAEDGMYEVTISSKDLAGNIPENSSDNFRIRFAVDTTAPELTSVLGMENSIVKADSQDVTITATDNIGLAEIHVYSDGALLAAWEQIEGYQGEYRFSVPSGLEQHIRIVVTDRAGNILDTDDSSFAPGYSFVDKLTVSTNILLRFYANKPAFYGSIGGVTAVCGVGAFILWIKKKQKSNEGNMQQVTE